jgi:glycosyltransferase involved in cell wall biosynthesis
MSNAPADRSPLVSIILPTHNGAKYLASAIDSCLAQTYTNFELILVDDCSTDSTPQIVAEYAARDSRIRSIRHATNQRLPAGLNTGHQAARGEYLTWTSDDNLLRPNYLAELVGYLQANPDVGFVYSDFTEIDEEGNRLRSHAVMLPEYLAWDSVVGASFLYRRSTFESVGLYDPAMIMAEDYDYWLRCYRATPMATLHKDLYQYRFHAGSLSTTRNNAQRDAFERALRKNLPYLKNAPRHLRAWGWLRVASQSARRKDLAGCLSAFCRALLLSPLGTVKVFFGRLTWKVFR